MDGRFFAEIRGAMRWFKYSASSIERVLDTKCPGFMVLPKHVVSRTAAQRVRSELERTHPDFRLAFSYDDSDNVTSVDITYTPLPPPPPSSAEWGLFSA